MAKSKKKKLLKHKQTNINTKSNYTLLVDLLKICFAILIILLTMLQLSNLSRKNNDSNVLGISTITRNSELLEERIFWQELLSSNPTYYEGWIELFQIDLNLGNIQEAQTAYQIAKEIDFNHQ